MLNIEELRTCARQMGRHHQIYKKGKTIKKVFDRIGNDQIALTEAYKTANIEFKKNGHMVPAGEWLIDNFYMIEEQIKEIQYILRSGGKGRLPVLTNGDFKMMPRVYAIACEIIDKTDGHVDEDIIFNFIDAYQKEQVLSNRELWSMPFMLKIALIKRISKISSKILETNKEWQKADIWADKFLSALEEPNAELYKIINQHDAYIKEISDCYGERLLKKLKVQGSKAVPIIKWLDGKVALQNTSMDEMIQQEHQRQTAYQISMGNAITSLRFLAGIKWEDIFEDLSAVEKILEQDPAGIYKSMDFISREYYRHQVEKLAETTGKSETDIATMALKLAQQGAEEKTDQDQRYMHIGYYLVDKGKNSIKTSLKNPAIIYIGGITGVFLLLMYIVLHLAYTLGDKPSAGIMILSAIVSVVPVLSITTLAINWVVNHIQTPRLLPRLELKDGIPEDFSTMVIIPTLLTNPHRVIELAEQMEVFYLANQEKNLYFALVGDFKDCKKGQCMPGDEKIVEAGIKAINELNARYGQDIFYFFHRDRQWNEAQSSWMGWERKRGALVEFNKLVKGDENTSYTTKIGNMEKLSSIKYIITLDADTQLPRDTAKKLIGAMAHPLNRPILNKNSTRVVDGYGLMQPRIGVAVDSASRSFFSLTFSGQTGIDPYTTAVSDVYQDFFGEGIFTGKGIYDVETFNIVLGDAIPQNTVLSHDLLEGSYIRAGLISDIELIDGYPSHYIAYSMRQHRWVRGDWQLIPWLGRRIKNARGEVLENPINAISKWKIFDNLRRSLLYPSLFILLWLAFLYLPGGLGLWIGLAVITLAFPLVLDAIGKVAALSKKQYIQSGKDVIWQVLLSFIFLAYQTYLMCDAIFRTIGRVFFTHRNMLEWVTAADTEKKFKGSREDFWRKMWPSTAIAILFFMRMLITLKTNLALAGVFTIIWALAPYVAYLISRPKENRLPELSDDQIKQLRIIARKTWRYFEDFVTAEDHWLPPDNYQEDPAAGVAHRTSPTNIGFLLSSTLAARDLGYIGTLEMIGRLERTINSIIEMDKWNGHLYNWYDTQTLRPMKPLYVSSVDSGNLACYLLVTRQGLVNLQETPIINQNNILGFEDTMAIYAQLEEEIDLHDLTLTKWFGILSDVSISDRRLQDIIDVYRRDIEELFPWVDLLLHLPRLIDVEDEKYLEIKGIMKELADMLDSPMSIAGLLDEYNNMLDKLSQAIAYINKYGKLDSLFNEALNWLQRIELALAKSYFACRRCMHRCRNLIEKIDSLFNDMDFSVLYDKELEIFSIGYDAEEQKLSNSYYDLLASEARQTSFIAIAKGDVPQKHWFKLGRTLTLIDGSSSLLSWSGTMFEYLMPLLIMRNYEYTLLDETYKSVIKAQMIYGEQRRVPWGVSESAFYAFDMQFNYQYKAFGVPMLGMKRGLINDIVISPYSTLMALSVAPHYAVKNIDVLIEEGLNGKYGMYEAIDYTPTRLPHKKKSMIVKSFMVHHLGMSLMALDNFLNDNIMQTRFHASPMVKATELLLQERMPQREVYIKDYEIENLARVSEKQMRDIRAVREYNTPHTSVPQVLILSNGSYSTMVTNSGSGYSYCKGVAVNRWRGDVTRDNFGMYFYIQNLNSNNFWSAAYQPCNMLPEEYKVLFESDKAVFTRRDGSIETRTEVVVSPEHNVEIRTMTIANKGKHSRVLDVTSYMEGVLSPLEADIAHPAFNNLFIQTEFIPENNALLAVRRPRDKKQKEVWAVHTVVPQRSTIGPVQYETDRLKFIGRGRDLSNPLAMEAGKPLSGSVGAVLDPIMSLRCRLDVLPGESVKLAFLVGMADSREGALALAQNYQSFSTISRTAELSWTHSQVELRYLDMNAEEANFYQDMAAHILYFSPSRRLREEDILKNRKGQSALWKYGISGDVPLVVMEVSSIEHMHLVKSLLTAHEYLRLKGIEMDLLFINSYGNSYEQPVQDNIIDMVSVSHARELQGKRGGVFVLQDNIISDEDKTLIMTFASLVFYGGEGGLSDQLNMTRANELLPKVFTPSRLASIYAARAYTEKRYLPKPSDLLFFNGLGGFSKDGREYIMLLKQNIRCPLPWSNIIANEEFGFLTTELGGGYTWHKNSRQNKLTPWSNDAVLDTPGEVVYLRDEYTGDIWTITPNPIPSGDSCVVRYGWGYSSFQSYSYGIEAYETMFVPINNSVKIVSISLNNTANVRRRISLTYYAEWVLGVNREETGKFITTQWDGQNSILCATNAYNQDFAGNIAFLSSNKPIACYTGDRMEFIGRNKNYENPAALKRTCLSGRTGGGYDSCGAVQVIVEIPPNSSERVVFMLGQEESMGGIKKIVDTYRDINKVDESLEHVKAFWQDKLGAISVSTPDSSMDIMLNGWLMYQTIVSRLWGRTSFYQAGGAYGFRDQLQDILAILYIDPDAARRQILLHASHQFTQGDVQHWWHSPFKGVRTRITDDRLFLPYVVAEYMEVTGDYDILNEEIAFLVDEPLRDDEHDRYSVPEISSAKATLYQHCLQAIDISLQFGDKGLPLMGGGDWNDGMDKVGIEGKGQSVWLGWFLYAVLNRFIPICYRVNDNANGERYQDTSKKLLEAVEKNAWDGGWYRRAYFDDGTPLGSEQNEECQIDSISQSWSVISGGGRSARVNEAMRSMEHYLVDRELGIIRLLTPPFEKSELEPGYIKGYVPGVRENGGQYTHAAMWAIWAFAKMGKGDKAERLFHMLNPINHTRTLMECNRYKVEPYVVAADVYSYPPNEGRGGWTWYTGSASWAYKVALEGILGFKKIEDKLIINPCIPSEWSKFSIVYRYGKSIYEIKVQNFNHVVYGVERIEVDGDVIDQDFIPLIDDGCSHEVNIVMGDS